MATATQMVMKPIQRSSGIGSPITSQPARNCMIGAMYCRMPSVLSGILIAAAANSSSGIAVSGPLKSPTVTAGRSAGP